MSSIPNGGGGITILSGAKRGFTLTWDNGGWQGNTILQPQATSPPGVTLSFSEGSVVFNEGNGTYGFNFSVTNDAQVPVVFNAQVSSI
jgi:hypothetical protein